MLAQQEGCLVAAQPVPAHEIEEHGVAGLGGRDGIKERFRVRFLDNRICRTVLSPIAPPPLLDVCVGARS